MRFVVRVENTLYSMHYTLYIIQYAIGNILIYAQSEYSGSNLMLLHVQKAANLYPAVFHTIYENKPHACLLNFDMFSVEIVNSYDFIPRTVKMFKITISISSNLFSKFSCLQSN